MLIKFCGFTKVEEIELFNNIKADYLGFVFARSKRQIDKIQAKILLQALDRSKVKVVGVFSDQSLDIVIDIAKDKQIALDVIQLHGKEDRAYIAALKKSFKGEIWKAIPSLEEYVKNYNTWEVDKMIIDSVANGGSGQKANWQLISQYRNNFKTPFILAGGLNKDNIIDGIRKVDPIGVDLSSGLEVAGKKDSHLMLEIIRKVRDYEK